jgi:ribA/ribD-fused uncharacterized protein
MPQVYNKHHEGVPADAVNVMRGTPFGNPFVIGRDGTRADVIRKYREWLCQTAQAPLRARIRTELRGRDLVCCCAPLPCHADTLLNYANREPQTPAPEPIVEFQGPFRFLSNFWPAPITLATGELAPSVEHAFAAAKAASPEDRARILAAPSPAAAKRFGRMVPLRPDWNDIRLTVMADLLERKFTQHPDLRARLIATAPRPLIEGNAWNDTFWGVCRGSGFNHLGRLLMALRDRLQNGAPV